MILSAVAHNSIAFSVSIHIIIDMKKMRPPPSTRALVAFECVARLGNVTRTAEYLNTSQAAVSRHLRHLEEHLGATLVTKEGRGIALTEAGKLYAPEVAAALSILSEAGNRINSSERVLTVACTHEVSHLILMPRYADFKYALGKGVYLQLLTCEYRMMPEMIAAGADIIFEYSVEPPATSHARVLNEAVIPMASPDFLEGNADSLQNITNSWKDIPRIELAKDNTGWATWDDWFSSRGYQTPDAPVQSYDNYVYALEAAIKGEGLVLGWRGFIERYLESGQLTPVHSDWLEMDTALYATATQNSSKKRVVEKFLNLLSGQ